MSKKAPNTKGTIEKVKVNTRKRPVLKKRSLAQVKDDERKPKLKFEKKKTKGEIFKEANGFSRSIARTMNKQGLAPTAASLTTYREKRKARKLAEKKVRQDKHAKSVLFKKTNGKKGKSGKANQVKAPKKP